MDKDSEKGSDLDNAVNDFMNGGRGKRGVRKPVKKVTKTVKPKATRKPRRKVGGNQESNEVLSENESVSLGGAKKRVKSSASPKKRKLSAYNLFIQKHVPGMTMKEAAAKWQKEKKNK